VLFTRQKNLLFRTIIGLSGVGMKIPTLEIKEKDGPFFGMNFGAGFDVKLSKKLFLNVEPKYVLSFINGTTGHGFTASAGFVIKF